MNTATVRGMGSADSVRTAALPDGRWMSVTGDTTRPGETLPAYDNSVVIWDRAGQRRVGTGNFFPRWSDGSEFWPYQWVADGSTIYVVGSRQLVRGGFDWTPMGAYIAVMTVPRCGTPRFSRYLSTPSSGLGDEAVQWYGAITRADGWFWIHGVLDRPDWFHVRDGGYIARTRNLSEPWRFWTGTAWSGSGAVPTIPVSAGGTEVSYTVHRISGVWTIVTKSGGTLASILGTFTSTSPTGPWTWTPRLTTCDLPCYLAGAAPIPTRSGRLMVQWSRHDALPAWAEI